MDGEPETIKTVCCEAALSPQDYYDLSIAFGLPPLGLGWMGAGDNRKSLLRSSTNPQDFYEPSIAFGLRPLGLGWMGAQDN